MNLSEVNISWFRAVNDLGKEYPMFNPVFEMFAEYTVFVLIIGCLYYWFSREKENRIMIISGGFSFVLAEIMGKLAGQLHSNNQPFAELNHVNQLIQKAVDNSFPSDHTILLFSICFSIWLVRKKSGFLWMILAFCTGISRIGVGVHYPFDVLVGAAIAMLSAYIIYVLAAKLPFITSILSIYEKIEEAILPRKSQSKDV